jgi:hypothetical protein
MKLNQTQTEALIDDFIEKNNDKVKKELEVIKKSPEFKSQVNKLQKALKSIDPAALKYLKSDSFVIPGIQHIENYLIQTYQFTSKTKTKKIDNWGNTRTKYKQALTLASIEKTSIEELIKVLEDVKISN